MSLNQKDRPALAQDEREIIGIERYRVVRYAWNFGIACVKAGDGERTLFQGHINDCKRVAAELATAFEDGKFVATRPAQTEQQPIGWITEDHLTDKSATTRPEVADRWRAKGWPVSEVYVAPIAQTTLSAVTAERDALAARLGEWERSKLAQIMRENVELTAERDRLISDNASLRGSCKALGEENKQLKRENKRQGRTIAAKLGDTVQIPSELIQ